MWLILPIAILLVALMLPYCLSSNRNTAEPMSVHLDFKPKMRNLIALQCGKELTEVIPAVASECYKFAILLGLKNHEIENDWNSPVVNFETKCQRILDRWLKSKGKGKTWQALIDAIKKFKLNILAEKINKCTYINCVVII